MTTVLKPSFHASMENWTDRYDYCLAVILSCANRKLTDKTTVLQPSFHVPMENWQIRLLSWSHPFMCQWKTELTYDYCPEAILSCANRKLTDKTTVLQPSFHAPMENWQIRLLSWSHPFMCQWKTDRYDYCPAAILSCANGKRQIWLYCLAVILSCTNIKLTDKTTVLQPSFHVPMENDRYDYTVLQSSYHAPMENWQIPVHFLRHTDVTLCRRDTGRVGQ